MYVGYLGDRNSYREKPVEAAWHVGNTIAYDKVEYKGPVFKYEIKKVIVNDGAVVVIFKDDNKVVVKRMAGDNDDIYSAVAQAVMKKVYGGTSAFHKTVDKLAIKQEKKVKV